MPSKMTRRTFCGSVACGANSLIEVAGSLAAIKPQQFEESMPNSTWTDQSTTPNLLSDPRFAIGARFRLDQFLKRGADPGTAEAIFSRLPDLSPEPWVREWEQLAEPCEKQGADFVSRGDHEKARVAYEKASMYYGIAKFPVINHPAKQAAYRKCIETYLKAAAYFDPPLERVTIPFGGKQIIGYLRRPKRASRPPMVIATGGVDVYKEERNTSDLLDAGLAAFSTDMPGNGECPVWYTPDAEHFYSAIIDYLLTRDDVDAKRLGIIGRSYGGYWAGKMAYVENKRICAAVEWGGPIHYTFQKEWLQKLQQDKLYLWPFLDSMAYAHHVKDIDELHAQAPTLSLKTQGWLNKPAAPKLTIDGAKDPWITIQDLYILLESGEPKAARVFPDDGHMGGTPEAGKLAMSWLKARLGA